MKHWLLLLAVPVTAYRSPAFGVLSLDLTSLLVPLAALLGWRFGKYGLRAVALGGLVFIPFFTTPFGAFGGNPNAYAVALAVAAILARRMPLLDVPRSFIGDRAAAALTFFMPLAMELFVETERILLADPDISVSFWIRMNLAGCFILFMMGMRGVRVLVLVLGMLVAAGVTWSLFSGGVLKRPTGMIHAGVSLFDGVEAFLLLATFVAGKAAAANLRGEAARGIWAWPYLTAAALLLLWYGPDAISGLTLGQLDARSHLFAYGIGTALPIAAFMMGLLRGRAGMIFATAGVIVLMALGGLYFLIEEGFGRSARLMLEAPFVAAAYAALGVSMNPRTSEARGKVYRIPALIAIVLSLAATVLDDPSVPRVVIAAILLVVTLASAVAAFKLRHESIAATLRHARDQCIALTALVLVASVLLTYLLDLIDAIRSLYLFIASEWQTSLPGRISTSFDDGAIMELSVIVLIYVAALAGTATGLVRTAPKAFKTACEVFRLVNAWRLRRRVYTNI